MMKKGWMTAILCTLLLAVTGCGSDKGTGTLDEKTLSSDGGIWTVDMGNEREYYEFDSDGEATCYDSKDDTSNEDGTKLEYSISESDDGYKLKMEDKDGYDGKLTIKIPKDSVTKDSFVGLGETDSDSSEGETVFSFTKRDSDYLD